MKIGKVSIQTPGLLVIGVVLATLVFVAGNHYGVWEALLKPVYKESGKAEKLNESLKATPLSIPASLVKAPDRVDDNPSVIVGAWTWQAMSGVLDAVGGPDTSGSYPDACLCQAGMTRTKILVENDTSKQIQLLASGQIHLVTTTGDQAAVDVAAATNLLKSQGKRVKVIWSGGYSTGEDCLLASEDLLKNPQLARGIVVVTAIPYCDWNVTVDWGLDSDIGINTDETTYDPDKINFVNASDHIEAAQKFVANEPVSLRNIKTGKSEMHQIDACATWTPGDVMAAKGRPMVNGRRLAKITSTKKYSYMMPHILFGEESWMNQHRQYIDAFLACAARSAGLIQSNPSYFRDRVAAVNASVFNMQGKGPAFWAKYFNVVEESGVQLGGSRVNNIKEVRHLFGLGAGPNGSDLPIEQSVFGITYTDHAKRLRALMPDRLPTYVPVKDVVDLSFIKDLSSETSSEPVYQAKLQDEPESSGIMVQANKQVHFASGSADINPIDIPTLIEIKNLLVRASDTKVIIEGHTDNKGSAAINLPLSQRRAEAVWNWLLASDPSHIHINPNRLAGPPEGYGSYKPIPGAGDAENRRVVIILK